MRYVGGKYKLSKHILPIILACRKPGQWYVEPFVGGFNSLCRVDGPRIANDIEPYLIALFRALQKGWTPPYVSESLYRKIKKNKELFSPAVVGFAGYGCAYRGKFFSGYARDHYNTFNNKMVYPVTGQMDTLIRQGKKLEGVIIENKSYLDLSIPENSIIYCDPPYADTIDYKNNIDHNEFWEWVRVMTSKGHRVFVSEKVAPDDFVCVFEKRRKNLMSKTENRELKSYTEKLFVHQNAHHLQESLSWQNRQSGS